MSFPGIVGRLISKLFFIYNFNVLNDDYIIGLNDDCYKLKNDDCYKLIIILTIKLLSSITYLTNFFINTYNFLYSPTQF